MNEQDIRIETRTWCGSIDTDRGASENQVENIALHFYEKGFKAKEKELNDFTQFSIKEIAQKDKQMEEWEHKFKCRGNIIYTLQQQNQKLKEEEYKWLLDYYNKPKFAKVFSRLKLLKEAKK